MNGGRKSGNACGDVECMYACLGEKRNCLDVSVHVRVLVVAKLNALKTSVK